MSLDVSHLGEAKRSPTCKAFRGGRVHEAELVSWFDENPQVLEDVPDSARKLKEQVRLIKAQADRQELILAKQRADLVEWSFVEEWSTKLVQNFKSAASNWFKNELAMSLEGMRAQEISAKLHDKLPEFLELFKCSIPKSTDTTD